MLRFPKAHDFGDPQPLHTNPTHKEPPIEEPEMKCDSLMQSQASMLMHTVRSSINEPFRVNDIHTDIAQMDAQLANLTMLCDNIQTQYYDMNKVECPFTFHNLNTSHRMVCG